MKHLIFAIVLYVSIGVVMALVWHLSLGWYLLVVVLYSFTASFFASWQLHDWRTNKARRKETDEQPY